MVATNKKLTTSKVKTVTPVSKNRYEKLFKLFDGEYVRFVLDMEIDQPLQFGPNVTLVQIPFTVDGYLFDEDDDYYFLSGDINSENINHAVRKEYIIHVEAIDPSEIDKELPINNEQLTPGPTKKTKPETNYN